MTHTDRNRERTRVCSLGWAATFIAALTLILGVARAASADQERFPSPEAAFKALVDAAKKGNRDRLLSILGPDGADVVFSGDDVADRAGEQRVVALAKAKTKLLKVGDATVIVSLGKDDWSFPIPLVKDAGAWRFDTAAGKEELLNRRIGNNELHTISVCHAYVDAQREYAAKDRDGDRVRQYAQKLVSDPSKRNGLYWEAAPNEAESPMGPLIAAANAGGYTPTETKSEPAPFHGYFFKILTAQGPHAPEGEKSYVADDRMIGGFALLAFPAHYGASGIMTFVVNQTGVVFQKNLGEKTAEIAAAITQYDPDDSWDPVDQ